MRIGRDFSLLWGGQTLTQLAVQAMLLILPLAAVLEFGAGPEQVGYLNAAQYLPVVLVTLYAGALIDSHRRRPLIVGSHLGRAVVLLAALFVVAGGLGGAWSLLVAAFGVGALTALYDVAHQAYVPDVVGSAHLVTANSRLLTSMSFAQVVGPGAGGLLVGWVGPRVALSVAAVSFGLAAVAVAAIGHVERRPDTSAGEGVVRRIRAGVGVTLREPLLGWVAVQAGWFNLCEQAVLTLFVVFGVRELGLGAEEVGLVIAVGGVGALLGALVAARLGRWVRPARLMFAALGLACAAPGLLPLAGVVGGAATGLATGAFIGYGFGLTVYNVFAVSLRQRLVPRELLGRATATFRLISYGPIPLGALLGGWLGDRFGLTLALIVCTVLMLTGWAISVRRLARYDAQIVALLAHESPGTTSKT